MITSKAYKILLITILLTTSSFAQQKKLLSLQDAIGIAAENSPDVQKSRLNMVKNEENLNALLYALKSKITFNVTPLNYSQTERYDEFAAQWYTNETRQHFGDLTISQPIRKTDGNLTLRNTFGYQDINTQGIPDNGFYNDLSLTFLQPLFTYNRTKMNLERLQLNLENSTISYSLQMLNMEKQVTQYFYTIYQRQMAYRISQEEYENQKASHQIIKSKVEAGLSAVEEEYQAELNLATSNSNLHNKKVELENSMDQFKRLVGISLYDSIELVTDIDYKAVEVNLEQAITNALQNRMELRQREIDLQDAQFALVETSATNEFRGDLRLQLGLMGNNQNLGLVYDKPTTSPVINLTFAVPLFDWGEKKAKMRAAEADLESRIISAEDQQSEITINIMQVFRNLQNLNNQIEIAEQNEKNAQLTYELNLERYSNGDLTSMDLQRFQNQLSEKKMNKVNALIDYKLELLNLKIQCLWDFEKGISFVPQGFENGNE